MLTSKNDEIVQMGGGPLYTKRLRTLWSTISVWGGVHLYIVHCFGGGDPPPPPKKGDMQGVPGPTFFLSLLQIDKGRQAYWIYSPLSIPRGCGGGEISKP